MTETTKSKAAPEAAEKSSTEAKATKTVAKELKELLESGAHFGHQTRRWNPKMERFIFTSKNGVHIIDLTKTVGLLEEAAKYTKDVASHGGSVLFVGTKRQGKAIIEKAAIEAGMPYVTQRWLGGMLTNLKTIQSRVNRLKKLESQVAEGSLDKFTKKEQAAFDQEISHLNRIFGGIKEMRDLPQAIFIVDVPREKIAIDEARRLGIPVIAVVDTNANPDLVDYVIPANDDAIKAVTLIVNKIATAAKEGKATFDAKTAKEEAKSNEEEK